MTVHELIRTRRSDPRALDTPLDDAVVQDLLQAAAWAPTHKRTEPWRFTLFSGEGRKILQNAWETGVKHKYAADMPQQLLECAKIQNKTLRAPLIITVWAAVGRTDKTLPAWEEHAAVAAAIQNMLLQAEYMGLAAIWRTGSLGNLPEVQALCRTEDDEFSASRGDKIMGFVYVGLPNTAHATPTRPEPEIASKVYSVIS